MELNDIRKWVLKSFRLNGYSVQAEGAAHLAQQLLPLNPEARLRWMDEIVRKIPDLNLDGIVLEKKHIEKCVDECTSKNPCSETIFNVISCLDTPCFVFNTERSKFVKDTTHKAVLFPPAAAKPRMFQRRYSLIMQRTQRHELFRKKLIEDASKLKCQLRTADFFLSSSDKIEYAVMLGLLAQSPEGHYILEDPTGSVRLDLSQSKFKVGLFTEQCFVIVEGVYDDQVFYVAAIGLPPAEKASQSRPYYGNQNCFGGSSDKSLSLSLALLKHQNSHPNEMLVFMSEVCLDKIQVIEKLKSILNGFSEFPPFAFILMGNFLSLQSGPAYSTQLKAALKALGELIAEYPSICKKSHFVLIPGPSDPGSPLILPRSPLPAFVAEDIKRKVPHLWLATNPCRIQYCTREIMVIREDIVTKLCRNVIHFPKDTSNIPSQFAKTIACQSSLAPLPLHVCPVYWSFSHGLDLYPLPDLVVVGDQLEPFINTYMDCHFINPGYFTRNEYSFHIYDPKKNTVEQTYIQEDDS